MVVLFGECISHFKKTNHRRPHKLKEYPNKEKKSIKKSANVFLINIQYKYNNYFICVNKLLNSKSKIMKGIHSHLYLKIDILH